LVKDMTAFLRQADSQGFRCPSGSSPSAR
jgi:hypothetical protein